MRIRFPSKESIFCAFKIIGGSAAVFAIVLDGINFSSCPPGTFCAPIFEFHAMRIDLWSVGTMLLALGLLLSALKDILLGLGSLELLERDIESIAYPFSENLYFHFGLSDF